MKMNINLCIEHLKKKIISKGRKIQIKNLKGDVFHAEMIDRGISVDNLGQNHFLPWEVFKEALKAMFVLGGSAPRGNAMNYRYGEGELRFETIEGRVANVVYGKNEGDSVFRRITPIASILIWADLCENLPGALKLKEIAYFDERIFRRHYNYFLALESDVESLFRYIEPEDENLNTYSIQLAHLLLSISSEIDVVLKVLCKEIDFGSKVSSIGDYRKAVSNKYPNIPNESATLKRFDLEFSPWKEWEKNDSPKWWQSYNKVKHERNLHFNKANLKNVLNAICGLLICLYYLRKAQIEQIPYFTNIFPLDSFKPDPHILKLPRDNYWQRSDR